MAIRSFHSRLCNMYATCLGGNAWDVAYGEFPAIDLVPETHFHSGSPDLKASGLVGSLGLQTEQCRGESLHPSSVA